MAKYPPEIIQTCDWLSIVPKNQSQEASLPVGDGNEVVAVVNAKGFSETVENIGTVVLPLEGRKLSTRRHVLHNLHNNAAM